MIKTRKNKVRYLHSKVSYNKIDFLNKIVKNITYVGLLFKGVQNKKTFT